MCRFDRRTMADNDVTDIVRRKESFSVRYRRFLAMADDADNADGFFTLFKGRKEKEVREHQFDGL